MVERGGRGHEGFHMVVDKRRGAGEEGAGHGLLSNLPLLLAVTQYKRGMSSPGSH